MTTISRVLEACLYATDLDAAERFYVDVLGLKRYSAMPGRHVFFRCGTGMFLVFNPAPTSSEPSLVGGAIVPAHGASAYGFPFLAAPGRLVIKDAIMSATDGGAATIDNYRRLHNAVLHFVVSVVSSW